jgi:cytidylate kinase
LTKYVQIRNNATQTVRKIKRESIGYVENIMEVHMSTKPNIAIDGPAGSGKSTVAKLVAEKLDYLYIDTGAMYRALTVKVLHKGINLGDSLAIQELTDHTTIELIIEDNRELKVMLDEVDVTQAIRTPQVSQNVSKVAEIPAIRRYMVKMQQALATRGGVVMEGRDIGTVVLPQASVKVFLTATSEERADRRLKELAEKGFTVAKEQMICEINERDRFDSERKTDPLRQAEDAFLINSSVLNAEEVAQIIIEQVEAVV